MIAALSKRFPGLEREIEAADVATPMTTERFTGNGVGYPMPDMTAALLLGRKLSQTLPGLRDFYMVGQWAGLAGLPAVASMGRDVVRQICRREARAFTSAAAPSAAPIRADLHPEPQAALH